MRWREIGLVVVTMLYLAGCDSHPVEHSSAPLQSSPSKKPLPSKPTPPPKRLAGSPTLPPHPQASSFLRGQNTPLPLAQEQGTPREINKTQPLQEEKKPLKEFPRFALRDLDHRESQISFEEGRVRFANIRQPIVIVTLLADRCGPCRGMMPYLSLLQKKYAQKLFVLGVLVHSPMEERMLRDFMLKTQSNFYLSNHPDGDRLGAFLASRLAWEATIPYR